MRYKLLAKRVKGIYYLNMKRLLSILGLVIGGYMLLDGLFVISNERYIGTEKPGPWAQVFYQLDIDVFKLGPLFVVLGLLWLIWSVNLWANKKWTYFFGLAISILSSWYLPLGTLLSIIIFILLLKNKNRLGN